MQAYVIYKHKCVKIQEKDSKKKDYISANVQNSMVRSMINETASENKCKE